MELRCFVKRTLEAASLEEWMHVTLRVRSQAVLSEEILRELWTTILKPTRTVRQIVCTIDTVHFFRMLSIISITLFCGLYASVIFSIYDKNCSQSSTRCPRGVVHMHGTELP